AEEARSHDQGPQARRAARPLGRRGDQDLALAGVVGGADDAFLLHPLDEAGGAIVADLQAALDVAGGRLAVAGDNGDRTVVEVVALPVAAEAQVAGLG